MFTAHRIESFLNAYNAPAAVRRISTGRTGVLRYRLVPIGTTRFAQLRALQADLAALTQAQSALVEQTAQGIILTLNCPRQLSADYASLVRSIAELDFPVGNVLLGLNEDGLPFTLNLAHPQFCHVVVAGLPGSGKTNLALGILGSLVYGRALGELAVVLADPKFSPTLGLAGLSRLPHLVRPVATGIRATVQLLSWLRQTVERRKVNEDYPHLVACIDDLAAVLANGGREVVNDLAYIAGLGREKGVHLILITQTLHYSSVPKSIVDNIPVRIVGRVGSSVAGSVNAGMGGTLSHKLGRHQFNVIVGDTHLLFSIGVTPESILSLIPPPALRTDEYLTASAQDEIDFPESLNPLDVVRPLWQQAGCQEVRGLKAEMASALWGDRYYGGNRANILNNLIGQLRRETEPAGGLRLVRGG